MDYNKNIGKKQGIKGQSYQTANRAADRMEHMGKRDKEPKLSGKLLSKPHKIACMRTKIVKLGCETIICNMRKRKSKSENRVKFGVKDVQLIVKKKRQNR
ncbi:MAG: hypothetical protein NC318_11015 [Blautia sp.]|nr:hypothetical protein [Lachnoclostridium sp.]MCM1212122.1 hypothetical protein [Blautia sp.]